MKKEATAIIAISLGIANTIVLYYTFICAYLNGFRTVVLINVYNEAFIEAIIIPFVIMFMVYSLWRVTHE